MILKINTHNYLSAAYINTDIMVWIRDFDEIYGGVSCSLFTQQDIPGRLITLIRFAPRQAKEYDPGSVYFHSSSQLYQSVGVIVNTPHIEWSKDLPVFMYDLMDP